MSILKSLTLNQLGTEKLIYRAPADNNAGSQPTAYQTYEDTLGYDNASKNVAADKAGSADIKSVTSTEDAFQNDMANSSIAAVDRTKITTDMSAVQQEASHLDGAAEPIETAEKTLDDDARSGNYSIEEKNVLGSGSPQGADETVAKDQYNLDTDVSNLQASGEAKPAFATQEKDAQNLIKDQQILDKADGNGAPIGGQPSSVDAEKVTSAQGNLDATVGSVDPHAAYTNDIQNIENTQANLDGDIERDSTNAQFPSEGPKAQKVEGEQSNLDTEIHQNASSKNWDSSYINDVNQLEDDARNEVSYSNSLSKDASAAASVVASASATVSAAVNSVESAASADEHARDNHEDTSADDATLASAEKAANSAGANDIGKVAQDKENVVSADDAIKADEDRLGITSGASSVTASAEKLVSTETDAAKADSSTDGHVNNENAIEKDTENRDAAEYAAERNNLGNSGAASAATDASDIAHSQHSLDNAEASYEPANSEANAQTVASDQHQLDDDERALTTAGFASSGSAGYASVESATTSMDKDAAESAGPEASTVERDQSQLDQIVIPNGSAGNQLAEAQEKLDNELDAAGANSSVTADINDLDHKEAAIDAATAQNGTGAHIVSDKVTLEKDSELPSVPAGYSDLVHADVNTLSAENAGSNATGANHLSSPSSLATDQHVIDTSGLQSGEVSKIESDVDTIIFNSSNDKNASSDLHNLSADSQDNYQGSGSNASHDAAPPASVARAEIDLDHNGATKDTSGKIVNPYAASLVADQQSVDNIASNNGLGASYQGDAASNASTIVHDQDQLHSDQSMAASEATSKLGQDQTTLNNAISQANSDNVPLSGAASNASNGSNGSNSSGNGSASDNGHPADSEPSGFGAEHEVYEQLHTAEATGNGDGFDANKEQYYLNHNEEFANGDPTVQDVASDINNATPNHVAQLATTEVGLDPNYHPPQQLGASSPMDDIKLAATDPVSPDPQTVKSDLENMDKTLSQDIQGKGDADTVSVAGADKSLTAGDVKTEVQADQMVEKAIGTQTSLSSGVEDTANGQLHSAEDDYKDVTGKDFNPNGGHNSDNNGNSGNDHKGHNEHTNGHNHHSHGGGKHHGHNLSQNSQFTQDLNSNSGLKHEMASQINDHGSNRVKDEVDHGNTKGAENDQLHSDRIKLDQAAGHDENKAIRSEKAAQQDEGQHTGSSQADKSAVAQDNSTISHDKSEISADKAIKNDLHSSYGSVNDGGTQGKLDNDAYQLTEAGDENQNQMDAMAHAQHDATCFCTGTMIKTVHGEKAVQDLCLGDVVITADGAHKPVKWIGFQEARFAAGVIDKRNTPVRIAKDALADGVPYADLYVSPAHAMGFRAQARGLFGGVTTKDIIVRAGALVNNDTISYVPMTKTTYWHVELEAHSLLVANGAAAESYQDMGNRASFTNGKTVSIHMDEAENTSGKDVAPRVKRGRFVRAVKSDIKKQARVIASRKQKATSINIA